MKLSQSRFAILGLARSGYPAALALHERNKSVVVLDQKTLEGDSADQAQHLRSLGIQVIENWNGNLDEIGEFEVLVTSPGVDSRSPILRAVVESGSAVWSEVELGYRISEAPIIGVTGSNGKSTTTVWTYLCLKACGEDAILAGNLAGSGYPEQSLTQAARAARPDQVIVAEISSFQLEWLDEFHLVSAGISTIVGDHLDRYDSFEDYRLTKHKIFNRQGPGDFAVLRAYDPNLTAPRSGQRVLWFGAQANEANITDRTIQIFDKQILTEKLKVLGTHNHANAAMSALLSYGYLRWREASDPASNAAKLLAAERECWLSRQKKKGKTPPQDLLPQAILPALLEFGGIRHRMESVGCKNGVHFINNSMCTNVDAVLKSATSVSGPKHLLMGGINKGLDFTPLRGLFATHNHAYLYGKDRDQVNEMLGGKMPTFETMDEAFFAAAKAAKSGEIVMLAPGCASTDQFKDFRERGDVFIKLATEWINQ